MSANGCSTSTGNIANNEFGNKNISGSIILKSKNNSQKKSANTIIKAHDNVAENEGYKMILPSTKGTAEQVLKIDSVTNNLLNLSWGEGGGGGGSNITIQDEGSSLATPATTLNFTGENVTASGTGATKTINITSDTYSQYSLETSQFSLLSGLTFDSGGGDFSKFFNNSNKNSKFVRFSVSSYPQSFTWTPHTSEVNYPLTKVVMWTRYTDSVNDTEMFPTQFKIYGRPTAGSSTGETEIGNIILSSQPSSSDNLLISSAAVNSVINTNKVVYNQYRIEIYENNSTNYSNRPLIGELRFYRPSSVEQYGNELTNWAENGAGHIIPNENSSYDIGSAEKKVRHLYLSNNSLNIGDVVLSSEGNDIKIGDNKLVKVTSEPIDGQGLVYSSGQWVPGSAKNYNYASSTSNAQTTVTSSWSDVTGMPPVTITPSSTSSIIKVSVDIYFEVTDLGHEVLWRLVRQESGQSDVLLNTTQPTGKLAYSLGIPFTSKTGDNSTTIDGVKFKYIEIPETTNQVSYKVQCRFPFTATQTLYLNSVTLGGSDSNREYMTSWIEAEQMN